MLDELQDPSDLRQFSEPELRKLASEIRERLIESVARHGGHLGPNLGVVELTIALHRVFESPREPIIWDTGHQAYVHKMVTGRARDFDTLRTEGGISGYPSQSESKHDFVENSHASTALSYADGLAKAFAIQGRDDHVVAVIGDGAMTGGMAWEAINNIAGDTTRKLVVVINDNGRSYRPTVGGWADHLNALRTNPRYEPTLAKVKEALNRGKVVGPLAYDVLHAIKRGMKDALAPQTMFEELGMKYLGPIDGHDFAALEQALAQAKGFGGPVLVHVVTTKGQGYDIAVENEADQMHQAPPFDRSTGDALAVAPVSWTSVFRDEIVRIADVRPDIVAITAAMLYPTGLDAFADKFPNRVFDVGIAEQHAVTSAAGMALGGLHPVVAVYATFLNRAFDQVLLDVALHKLGVTFVLDRAGVTGDDGASHNGMWDLSLMQIVPGIHIAAPRDGEQLRKALRTAVDISDAPSVVRFAKGAVVEEIPALEAIGKAEILLRGESNSILVVAVGSMVSIALEVADKLPDLDITIVDPVWIKPLEQQLVDFAQSFELVYCLEDNGRQGGFGVTLSDALNLGSPFSKVQVRAVEQEFLDHASRASILKKLGLDSVSLAEDIKEHWAKVKR